MQGKQLHETQAIIIGAGPAGAATSFFLTKYEIPHVVIDKAVFPRDKVCGDACSGKTTLVIRRAHAAWLQEMNSNTTAFLPSWGIVFGAPNGRLLEVPFLPNRTEDSAPAGFTTQRLVFDEFLFRKMQSPFCTIVEGADVTHTEIMPGGTRVLYRSGDRECEVTAPVLVGADGDKSTVRRNLLPTADDHKAYSVGIRGYYEGVADLHRENFIELHFLPELLPGYLWIFPLPGGMANVGVGMLSQQVRKQHVNLKEVMLRTIETHAAIAPRFRNARLNGKLQGWGLPLATKQQRMSGDRLLLTGDAARLIDPFTGEGIGNAMYSGMLAADAIKAAQTANDYGTDFLKQQYDNVFYKRMGSELSVSNSLHKLCRYPRLFNFVVNKAINSPALSHTISCMFADVNLRARFRQPSFYFNILFNR